jgi:two-component system, NtrC family, sensor kinase
MFLEENQNLRASLFTGMPPAVAARAFEPFFTTKADTGRSGLGLSQVYGYARQSGGRTEIDSGTGRSGCCCRAALK